MASSTSIGPNGWLRLEGDAGDSGLLNGELRVDSEPGRTAFTLTLPVAVVERVLTRA